MLCVRESALHNSGAPPRRGGDRRVFPRSGFPGIVESRVFPSAQQNNAELLKRLFKGARTGTQTRTTAFQQRLKGCLHTRAALATKWIPDCREFCQRRTWAASTYVTGQLGRQPTLSPFPTFLLRPTFFYGPPSTPLILFLSCLKVFFLSGG